MLIPQSTTWEPGFRKRTVKKEVKIGPISLKFLTVALITVGALLYLAQSAQTSSQKYQLMQLGAMKKEAEAKSNDLEIEAARLKSLNEIKASSATLGFEQSSITTN
jgi:hypothetical protein